MVVVGLPAPYPVKWQRVVRSSYRIYELGRKARDQFLPKSILGRNTAEETLKDLWRCACQKNSTRQSSAVPQSDPS